MYPQKKFLRLPRRPGLIALRLAALLSIATLLPDVSALERPGVEFKIFQFPADKIPHIDGDPADWAIVPDSYAIGLDQLRESPDGRRPNPDKKSLDVKVRVGWVKGLDRLFILYDASDDYWDFADHSRHNDIFELVVDGDLSGGPLVGARHQNRAVVGADAFFQFHGVHAQNYHIFTPAPERDWAFVWGCQPWIKELPWANAAYRYDFKPGGSGPLVLEFWITPFDYAPYDGPARAVVSKLTENKVIGLSWAVMDYDDPKNPDPQGFWNLSHKTSMAWNADDLVAFRLMPLEARFLKPIDAHWSFKVLDMDRREVAFHDDSIGQVTAWQWDFGDGTESKDQHPIHRYEKAGEYVVNLYIEGPAGKSRWTKVRDVVLR
ncbi:MAG: PKD domain-containing protein [Opitutus sp.]|nr:PKD domain-containing protein [Opitutus sp.]